MGRQMAEWFSAASAFVLGRRTYEIFAAHWPYISGEHDPIARALNGLPKHVASHTLDHLSWDGARLIEGDRRSLAGCDPGRK